MYYIAYLKAEEDLGDNCFVFIQNLKKNAEVCPLLGYMEHLSTVQFFSGVIFYKFPVSIIALHYISDAFFFG